MPHALMPTLIYRGNYYEFWRKSPSDYELEMMWVKNPYAKIRMEQKYVFYSRENGNTLFLSYEEMVKTILGDE
jgi:hypothetical protein